MPLFPLVAVEFHQGKVVSVSDYSLARNKPALLEAFLCPGIPDKRFKVNSVEVGLRKDVFYQGIDGVISVSLVPVVMVANHDTQFSLTFSLVYRVVAAVADVLAVEGLNAELPLGGGGVEQLGGMVW